MGVPSMMYSGSLFWNELTPRIRTVLREPGEPLASIALRSGFADQSHMCRVFYAAYGVSPGEFRRVVQG